MKSAKLHDISTEFDIARENAVRDFYAANLNTLRDGRERLVGTEMVHANSLVRADMRTVDSNDVIREWEFKLVADYSALGQILVYTAALKVHYNFQRDIRGVIAALKIPPEISQAVRVGALNIELVVIPSWIYNAGAPTKKQANIPRRFALPSTS